MEWNLGPWKGAVAVVCAVVLGSAPAAAAFDIFLAFDPEIAGESGTPTFEDTIDVESIGFGGQTNACDGKVLFLLEFTFTKDVDRASVPMYAAMDSGTIFNLATFSLRELTGDLVVFNEYIFSNARLTSVSAADVSQQGIAKGVEVWSLAYSSVTIRYTLVNRDGSAGSTEEVVITPASCAGS